MKTCTKCGEEKELSEFPKSKLGKDGVRNPCRECYGKYAAELRIKNPEYRNRKIAHSKDWAIKNPERMKQLQAKWAINNRDKKCLYAKRHAALYPEKIIKRGSNYRIKNIEKIKEYQLRYYAENKVYWHEWKINHSDSVINSAIKCRDNKNLRERKRYIERSSDIIEFELQRCREYRKNNSIFLRAPYVKEMIKKQFSTSYSDISEKAINLKRISLTNKRIIKNQFKKEKNETK